jgi:hypothetical protein
LSATLKMAVFTLTSFSSMCGSRRLAA